MWGRLGGPWMKAIIINTCCPDYATTMHSMRVTVDLSGNPQGSWITTRDLYPMHWCAPGLPWAPPRNFPEKECTNPIDEMVKPGKEWDWPWCLPAAYAYHSSCVSAQEAVCHWSSRKKPNRSSGAIWRSFLRLPVEKLTRSGPFYPQWCVLQSHDADSAKVKMGILAQNHSSLKCKYTSSRIIIRWIAPIKNIFPNSALNVLKWEELQSDAERSQALVSLSLKECSHLICQWTLT